jgi:hypothetical protein
MKIEFLLYLCSTCRDVPLKQLLQSLSDPLKIKKLKKIYQEELKLVEKSEGK